MLYASATRGFKSGGFDFGSSTPEDQKRGYAPEYLWSYELGMKSQWLEDRLRVNATAFFYDYKDLQVTLYKDNINAITRNGPPPRSRAWSWNLPAGPTPSWTCTPPWPTWTPATRNTAEPATNGLASLMPRDRS